MDASITTSHILVQKNPLRGEFPADIKYPLKQSAVFAIPTFTIWAVSQTISLGWITAAGLVKSPANNYSPPNYTINPNIQYNPNSQFQNFVNADRTLSIVTDGDVRLKYRYYSAIGVDGDSGSGVFVLYQNAQKTIKILCLLGNMTTGGGLFGLLAPQISRIQQQIAAWGNT